MRAHASSTPPPRSGSVTRQTTAYVTSPSCSTARPPLGLRTTSTPSRAHAPMSTSVAGCSLPRLRHAGANQYTRTAPAMSPRAQRCRSSVSRRMFSAPLPGPSRCRVSVSDVETEVHDVAIADNVVATLQSLLSLVAHRSVGTRAEQRLDVHHLGTDEPRGEIRMNGRGRIQRCAAFVERPRAHLLLPGGEERDQAQQVVCGACHTVEPRLIQAEIQQECGPLGEVEVEQLGFYERRHGDRLTTRCRSALQYLRGNGIAGACLVHVDDDQEWLCGEEPEVTKRQALRGAEPHGAHGLAGVEVRHDTVEQVDALDVLRLLQPHRLLCALEPPTHGLEIGELQLELDHIDVAAGIDAAFHMADVRVVERAHDQRGGIA